MRSKTTKKYLDACAAEHGITIKQMTEIAEAPFRFTAEVFRQGNRETMDFSSVRIMYFGRFAVKPGRLKHFKEKNERS